MQQDAAMTHGWRWAVAFFVVTYLVTALLWLPILRSGESLSAALAGPLVLPLLLASVTPSLVAFVLAGIEGGPAGVGQLLGQAGRWRFGIGWYGDFAGATHLGRLAGCVTPARWSRAGGKARFPGAGRSYR